jgi:hypothetical protein
MDLMVQTNFRGDGGGAASRGGAGGGDAGGEEVSTPVSRLSGGEKSFSTLCLILALKQTNQSPLLALDEIDVFMDERSRRIALQVTLHPTPQTLHTRSQTLHPTPWTLDPRP